jgi:hypothetical protein
MLVIRNKWQRGKGRGSDSGTGLGSKPKWEPKMAQKGVDDLGLDLGCKEPNERGPSRQLR